MKFLHEVSTLGRIVVGLAAAWLAFLVVTFATRIAFPLELEWMEGGAILHARTIAATGSVYPPPSTGFVPFLYTPLYPLVLTALGVVFPIDLVLGRVVSIAAVAVSLVAIWRAIAREGRSVAHRALGVGLAASGYVFTFRWADVARADSLALALALWGLVSLRSSWGRPGLSYAAGVLLALAFWTKQTMALLALAAWVAGFVAVRREVWRFALTLVVATVPVFLLGNLWSDGRLMAYVYELHQQHAFNHERFVKKSWGMLLHAAPFVALALVVALVDLVGPLFARGDGAPRRLREPLLYRLRLRLPGLHGVTFWGIAFVAALVASALGYSTQWAEPNAFLPAVWLGAIFVAVALPASGRGESLGLGLGAAQLGFAALLEPTYQPIQDHGWSALPNSYLPFDPRRGVPTHVERAHAAALAAELRATPAPMLSFHRPYWSSLSSEPGQPAFLGHVGAMNLSDVTPTDQVAIRRALVEAIDRGDYRALWFEGEPPAFLRGALARSYRLERRLHGEDRVRPLTGYMSEVGMVTPYDRDQLLFLPIGRRSPPKGGIVLYDFEDGAQGGFSFDGSAFARKPARGVSQRMPSVGPYGGEFLLSSGHGPGGLAATGSALSRPFSARPGQVLELLAGAGPAADDLRLELIDLTSGQTTQAPFPATRFTLATVQITLPGPPAAAAPASYQLRLIDASRANALFLDDVWVLP